ncbi:MAG: sugar phosphate isomerase/epimerase family protein [Bryobacteraceae bacterium]
MIKISNYSLNYARMLSQGQMTIFEFLGLCRQMGLEGASLHVRDLPELGTGYLKKVRRAYLDMNLSMSMFTVSTDFGNPREGMRREIEKAAEAIRVAMFLGAPILRVFAGSPPKEGERAASFDSAVAGVRKVCEEAAEAGLAIGLQNHNHGALCRTGEECIRFMKKVDHPSLVFLLDTGQFAGSRGASATVPPDLAGADFMESIRLTAPLARHVRVKFYNPREDGSEPWIDYDAVFNIFHGVHYQGWIDIVYEPGKGRGDPGEDIRTAIPRVVRFLRRKTAV